MTMSTSILACGPYISSTGLVSTAIIFLALKPFAYFAFIHAYRYRVSKPIPMTTGQAVWLAALRAIVGVVFVGGGAWGIIFMGHDELIWISWIYLYASRLLAWWLIGSIAARIRGKRLLGWIIFGTMLNASFDLAVVGGLVAGWIFPTITICIIAGFLGLLHRLGRRAKLKNRFDDAPHCRVCEYNLTGNLSGICPECGTQIALVC